VGASARKLYPTQADFDYVGDEKYRQIAASGTGAVETRWQRKDGTIIDVLLASTPLDPEDLDQGVTFTALDITERARLLARLQEQARRLRGILDAVPEGVLLLDGAGRILLSNPVATAALPELGTMVEDGRLTALGDRALDDLLVQAPTASWHEVKVGGRTFEATSSPIAAAPTGDRFVLVFRDVTWEREMDQALRQQERLAVVGQMAAGIAHDFNNILAVIVLYTQMDLQMPDLPARLRTHIETILGQAQHAASLVQQILDFGRRAMLKLRPVDLRDLLVEQVALLSRTLPESIRLDLAPMQAPARVLADRTRMQQVLANLTVNARDAMPEGGELTFAISRLDLAPEATPPLPEMAPGAWVKLSVTDTGTGIPAETLPHIFEPFYTTKPPGEGSGLGLPQVYGIVKQHQGHIGVTTEEGRGTTFTIYLPALAEPADPDRPEGDLELPLAHHAETVLVVEDDTAVREALVGSLGLLGYRTLAVADGRAALDLLLGRSGPDDAAAAAVGIDVVLSDMVMPEMGGAALFQAARAQGIEVPFVMLTGHPLDAELKALAAEGIAGWLRKPVPLDQLANTLLRVLAATRA
jgi:two-component system, cell cycle sensor histidine kinase and response regulator CckA